MVSFVSSVHVTLLYDFVSGIKCKSLRLPYVASAHQTNTIVVSTSTSRFGKPVARYNNATMNPTVCFLSMAMFILGWKFRSEKKKEDNLACQYLHNRKQHSSIVLNRKRIPQTRPLKQYSITNKLTSGERKIKPYNLRPHHPELNAREPYRISAALPKKIAYVMSLGVKILYNIDLVWLITFHLFVFNSPYVYDKILARNCYFFDSVSVLLVCSCVP